MATEGRANPKALETVILRLKEIEAKVLKVGWFENNKYEGGYPVAAAAAGNELGIPSRSIPPRPFMRPTVTNRKQAWVALAARGAAAIVSGKETVDSVMAKLGEAVKGDIQQSIVNVTEPPLSPITLQLRAWRQQGRVITGRTVGEAAHLIAQPGYQTPSVSRKPLVETNRMLTSIASVVEDA